MKVGKKRVFLGYLNREYAWLVCAYFVAVFYKFTINENVNVIIVGSSCKYNFIAVCLGFI